MGIDEYRGLDRISIIPDGQGAGDLRAPDLHLTFSPRGLKDLAQILDFISD